MLCLGTKGEEFFLKYSIDKIKLEFQYIKLDRVQSFLNKLSGTDYNDYYESNKVTKCKHNFRYATDEGSVYVGVIPNWKNESRYDKSIVLEYNPNKVNPFLSDVFSWLKRVPRACIKVMSFDIAVDMYIPYESVRMLKRDKRESFAIFGHSDVETRYLGAMGHNHIKLYNKGLEQKLNVDWTRFEITVKEINSFSCTLKEFETSIKIPTLYYVCSQIGFDEYEQLNDTTRIILESIIDDINVLYTIKKYDTRKKYEKMLGQFLNPIDISVKNMYKCFIDYFDSLFNIDLVDSDIVEVGVLLNKLSIIW